MGTTISEGTLRWSKVRGTFVMVWTCADTAVDILIKGCCRLSCLAGGRREDQTGVHDVAREGRG